MPVFNAVFFLKFAEIVWVDILLSGDNALVIALACRGLPENQRKVGMFVGGAAAVALRLLFALVIVQVLNLPYLKLIGGVVLFWIAIKLVIDEDDHGEVKPGRSLWKAVQTIAIADAVMSFDNVLAIVAIAQEDFWLIALGLLASMPLIIGGSALLLRLINRFPVLIWAGCALLGYVAAGIILSDDQVRYWLDLWFGDLFLWRDNAIMLAGAGLCVAVAYILDRRAAA